MIRDPTEKQVLVRPGTGGSSSSGGCRKQVHGGDGCCSAAVDRLQETASDVTNMHPATGGGD